MVEHLGGIRLFAHSLSLMLFAFQSLREAAMLCLNSAGCVICFTVVLTVVPCSEVDIDPVVKTMLLGPSQEETLSGGALKMI